MKDAYWFRHDSNARNDEKIIDLRGDLGYEGYGLYWGIIEYLRDNENYEAEYKPQRLAMVLQSDPEIIKQVIEGYRLFQFNESGKFFSSSLKERMKEMDRKRSLQREKALKRWGKEVVAEGDSSQVSHGNAVALPRHCHKNKEKEIKKEQNKSNEKTLNKRGQGEKEELSFFNECLKVRNAYPIILFFEYTYFVFTNDFNSTEEYRTSFLGYWKKSSSLIESDQIIKRLLAMAKIGFGLSREVSKFQLNIFLENQKDRKSEEVFYKVFLDQLKKNGFEPVKSLKVLAGNWLEI